jgi:RNA polymerase sigma factor (sigma-70 family)
MLSGRFETEQTEVRENTGPPEVGSMSDGHLLDRYIRHRDAAAFGALVQRYGPLVLGVCQRVLQDSHDAEDAFQATFLVLMRRAASLDRRGPLGNWLYGVAYRTALKARTRAARRRAYERQVVDTQATDALEETMWADLRPVLDEELSQLPEKYRAPLVLCCLEGKTHQEAASALGWPSGSMSRRMSRAREILRERLTRRGIFLSTGLLLFLLTNKASAVTVPAALTATTIKTVVSVGAGMTATSVASASVRALAEEVLRAMAATRLPRLTRYLWLLAVFIPITGGTGLITHAVWAALTRDPALCGGSAKVNLPPPTSGRLRSNFEGHTGPVLSVALSADGTLLASGAGPGEAAVRLWSVTAGKLQAVLTGHAGGVPAVAFAPDGKLLASGGADGTIRLWDMATASERKVLRADPAGVLALAFAPDGKTLASSGADSTIKLWDVADGQQRSTLLGHHGPVHALAFSPDGGLLAGGEHGGSVSLWEPASGQLRTVLAEGGGAIHAVAFTPDGCTLATGGDDQTVRLWDLATQKQRSTLTGHTASVRGLAFVAEGTMLASAGQDKNVRLWNVAAARSKAVLPGHAGPIQAVAGAGNLVATAGADGKVKLWEVAPAQP